MRHRTLSIVLAVLVWLAAVGGCSDSGGSKGSGQTCSESCDACQRCVSGQCQPAVDGTGCLDGQCHDGSCCTGCWDGEQCVTGDTSAVCGGLGVACEDCRTSMGACIAQTCQPPCEFSDVAVGQAWACAIHPSQLLYCWGSNTEGQLGVTGSNGRSAPLPVGRSNRWKQLAAGDSHSCGLVTTSDVWCWGSNASGQLGVGDTSDRSEPSRVVGDIAFAQVAAGGSDTCAIDTQGKLHCWGKSATAQAPLQVGKASDWVLVDVGSSAICGIRGAGDLYCWSAGTEPARVGTASNFRKVAVGDTHRCAIDTVGTLYCWGKNDFGQLGIGSTTDASSPTRIDELAYRSVALGAKHSCAVATSGELRCWGSNSVGQLGLSSGPSATGILKPSAPDLTDEFDRVLAGGNVTCVLAGSGRLYCFGDNASGALVIGSSGDTAKPIAVCVAEDTSADNPDAGTSSLVCPNTADCKISACAEKTCGRQGEVCRRGVCVCPSGAATESDCRNGSDDDCDGRIDCADSDCATAQCGANAHQRCCDATCVDTTTDTANCQGCGLRCASGRCEPTSDSDGVRGHCTCSGSGDCPKNPGQICRAGNNDGQDGLCACDVLNQGNSGCASGQTCANVAKANFCHY